MNKEIWFKNETTNPTGSFKDRGSSVEITKALELGATRLVCATTGNMGASVAAYSARAKLSVKIFIPSDTPRHKLMQISVHGAKIIKTKDYTTASASAERLAKTGYYYLAGDYPYRGEGQKSIGFEIADQFHFKLPDAIVMPIGNGTLMWAVYKALHELSIVGLIQRIPKLIGVQAAGCAPIVHAFEAGIDGIHEPIKPVKPRTIASAIEVGNPIDGPKALTAINRTGGFALAVSDREILAARNLLGREGIYAESGGAAATAGLIAAMKNPKFAKQLNEAKEIVVLVTGHGLKG
jgi:threonine synthase